MPPLLYLSCDADGLAYRHALLEWKRELGWIALLPPEDFTQEERLTLLRLSLHVIFVIENSSGLLSARMRRELDEALSLGKHIIVLRSVCSHPLPKDFAGVDYDLMPSFSCDALIFALRGWNTFER